MRPRARRQRPWSSLACLTFLLALGCGGCRSCNRARPGAAADGSVSSAGGVVAQPRSSPLPSSVRGPAGAWYGIYLGGRKAGWARMQLRRATWKGRPVREVHSRLELRATYGGLEVAMTERSSRFYERTPSGRLLGVRKRLRQGPVETEVEVERKGDRMVAVRRIAGREERREVPASKETIDQAMFAGGPRRTLRPGEVLRGHIFWEDALRDFAVVTRVLSSKEEYLGGVRLALLRIRTEGLPLGLRLEGRVGPGGEVVLARVGPMSLRLEGEATARAPYARSDLLDIGPRVSRLRPRRLDPVRMRVAGLPAALAVDDRRQRFLRQPDGSYLVTVRRLSRPPGPAPRLPIARADLAPTLRATATLQADHPEIRRAAREAIGGERDAYRAALRLRDWVHRHLRSTWHRTIDALTALRAGGGMCYEFAHVLAAMARSVGLPARLAYGLIYAEVGTRAVFGGHAWTEIWVGGWLPFDATEAEGPALGPHLKLAGSDNPGAAVSALGDLQITWR